ncbi:MAG: SIMPL domain-containing protein [Winogradskyella sp.]|nr:SIMPL domain-containing protein [Winogradskyella sp.]NNC44740.1 SIMPL domain-containing protein [Winogradskyella sp.]NNF86451.1 SIMPL domain-containing protein [Winogradskyella sp.]NNK39929.1 SIMPL domain-containing protein [Winogradskyella sp.]NNL81880.1 SIMPL domain-containing protein [Winogradskyella sp.]
MKSNSLIKWVILSIAIIVSGYFISTIQIKARAYDRQVQVKGLSEREVNADLAVWPMSITLTGNDLKSLKQDIETQNEQVYHFFIDLGFTADELTVGNTNINDAKADLYNSNSYNTPFRYLSKTDFTVRTTDLAKLKTALSKSLDLLSKDILIGSKNTWQPVEYIFTRLNDIKPEMIEEATKNAREVAEKFARDSNSEVGKIKMARQGQFSIYDRDANTPEIKTVRVVSTIDYQLKN